MGRILRTPTTAELLATLEHVRTRLSERNYFVAEVADKYRRSVHDFVVLQKDRPRNFAIVRKAKKMVVVRPFATTRGGDIQLLLRELEETPAPVRLSAPLLHFPHGSRDNPWQHYVSDECHEELIALGCLVRPEKAA